MERQNNLLKSKMFWVGILYFAEGFPYGVFYDVFPVHFRQQGVDLKTIGLLGLLGLAWSFKFIWAPAVDYFRHHRRWIFAMDALMGAILLVFSMNARSSWEWMFLGLALFALFSATSDIAIDGYTIELLDKSELGLANGLRIAVYRVGILGAGFILVLSGQFSWSLGYLAAGLILCLFGALCLLAPKEKLYESASVSSIKAEMATLLKHPGGVAAISLILLGCLRLTDSRIQFSADRPHFWPVFFSAAGLIILTSYVYAQRGKARSNASSRDELDRGPLFGAVFELLQRPFIVPVIFFILAFKLGDTSMGFMVKPFWVDSGFSATEIGLVSVNIGLVLSIAGGLAGGWFTDRFGIFKALWILGLFQAVSNLGYAATAFAIPHPAASGLIETKYRAMIYASSMIESFTGGLGNGPFLAFLMAIVNKQKAATEYALLSSIFALSRQMSYWASGYGAEMMGYANYFTLTFFLAFPAYLLLPWVKRTLENGSGNGPR